MSVDLTVLGLFKFGKVVRSNNSIKATKFLVEYIENNHPDLTTVIEALKIHIKETDNKKRCCNSGAHELHILNQVIDLIGNTIEVKVSSLLKVAISLIFYPVNPRQLNQLKVVRETLTMRHPQKDLMDKVTSLAVEKEVRSYEPIVESVNNLIDAYHEELVNFHEKLPATIHLTYNAFNHHVLGTGTDKYVNHLFDLKKHLDVINGLGETQMETSVITLIKVNLEEILLNTRELSSVETYYFDKAKNALVDLTTKTCKKRVFRCHKESIAYLLTYLQRINEYGLGYYSCPLQDARLLLMLAKFGAFNELDLRRISLIRSKTTDVRLHGYLNQIIAVGAKNVGNSHSMVMTLMAQLSQAMHPNPREFNEYQRIRKALTSNTDSLLEFLMS